MILRIKKKKNSKTQNCSPVTKGFTLSLSLLENDGSWAACCYIFMFLKIKAKPRYQSNPIMFTDRWTNILYDFTFMLNLKNQTNEQTKLNRNTGRDAEKKQAAAREEGVGGKKRNRWRRWRGIKFHFQNKRVMGMKCTLWGIESITMWLMSLYGDIP